MGMRQQFTSTMQDIMDSDDRVVTLLNDIGVFAFRHIKAQYPDRIYNLGILEQSSIGIAAGLSLSGMIPVFHTIAPFIVERGYEQLKDDFGYQNINGNFVSVGGSYDYSKLGMTHYCPGDIGALMQIPNMQIIIPGTEEEFDVLLKSQYDNGKPTYYRLSERSNSFSNNVTFRKAVVIKRGTLGTVIAVGNMLDRVIEAVNGFDVSILYYTTVCPFDDETLINNTVTRNIILCEPYYYGALTSTITDAFKDQPVKITHIGIPHQLLNTYGTVEEMDKALELDVESIRNKIQLVL